MTSTSADDHDRTDDPDGAGTDEETQLVVEFTVPADRFLLATTLAAVPDVIVEFEQFVPTQGESLPYLWTTNGDHSTFEEALEADPAVESSHRVATLDQGALYEIDWVNPADDDGILGWLRNNDVTVLQSEAQNDEWQIKLRVESRDRLRDLQTYCKERDIDFNLVRLFRLTEPKMGQFNVSEKQHEILVAANEMGYFEIPRGATLGAVAESIGISTKAASERLRRGQTNLVNNTLTVGRPSGIGIDRE